MTFVRLAVAYVFVVSGAMKLMSPDLAETFRQLGLPYPEQLMTVVALLEIICGAFILMNRGARLAAIPLMVIMVAALVLTKVPLIATGVTEFAFAARLDIVMLLLLLVLYNHHGLR